MTACSCDYDETFSVYRKSEHTARKPHKCYECGRSITPGERYESAFGILGGDTYTMPTCSHCLALRAWVVAHVPCSCWSHGRLLEDMAAEVEEYGPQAPGLTFGYLRRLVALQRARGWVRLPRPYRYFVSAAQHAKLQAAGKLTPKDGVLEADPVLSDDLCDAYRVPRGSRRSEVTDTSGVIASDGGQPE